MNRNTDTSKLTESKIMKMIASTRAASPRGYSAIKTASATGSDALESLQNVAALKNMYITGVKFGRSPSFMTYMFDSSKGRWASHDKSGKPKGQWKSPVDIEKVLAGKIPKHYPPRMIIEKGIDAFKYVDGIKSGGKGVHQPLPRISGSAFGFAKQFQLYPLGKDAYFKGPHKGVSSGCRSEAEALKLGLIKPPSKIPNPPSGGGWFQFGHSFGKANDWTRDGVINAYTGKPMSGIPEFRLGFDGTQGPYTGLTGMVGGARRIPASQLRVNGGWFNNN